MSILEEIVLYKKLEVDRRKADVGIADLQNHPFFSRKTFSLKKALADPLSTGIIAEFKRRSPSRGNINVEADAGDVTAAYSRHGAAGISVLTDEKFFGGSSADLEKARNNDIPILRKDFIVDEYQVYETKAMGADLLLLIAACLKPAEVKSLAGLAKKLGLEVLLEVHNEGEMEHLCSEIDIVGVNNRNLKSFEVNLQNSIDLAGKLPDGMIRISESGINSVDDILLLKENGFHGFLIGEKFMQETDPGESFGIFTRQLKEATTTKKKTNI